MSWIVRIERCGRVGSGESGGRGLADDGGARALEHRDDGRIPARTEAAIDRRTHLGRKLRGVDDVLLFCGGIIPEEDTRALEALGFKAIFRPGTNTQDIVKFVYEHVQK